MSFETTQIDAQVWNKAFVDKLDAGLDKEAQESGSEFIRLKLREGGVLRRLFESRTVTADELDPSVDDDKPRILVEKEPEAPKATFVPFKGTGDRAYFEGVRFPVPFGKVESERMSKSKYELMTIRMPIMDWLEENQVKAVQNSEDEHFMETINQIVTDNSSEQTLGVASSSNSIKEAVIEGLKAMTALSLPTGKLLMNQNTMYDTLNLKTDEIGFKAQDERWQRGVSGEDSLLGYPVVTTIKHDLVPENVIWFFAPQEYFAKFYFLQDATLFLKSEADMVTFHTYEAPGMGVGNTRGCLKLTIT